MNYLKRTLKEPVTLRQVTALLKDHKATNHQPTLRGQYARVWSVPLNMPTESSVPPLPENLTNQEF